MTTFLWIYTAFASIVFGAELYEVLVVHPAWSRNPPESFAGFSGARLNIAGFWKPMAPLYALSGLGALALAFRAGVQGTPLIVSVICAVDVVAWTLLYFRPRIERFLVHGVGTADVEWIQAAVRRWILLNWIRLAIVAISWWGALATLTTGR